MESFLRKPIQVPFASLFLDPNNPRLAREDHPGYDHPARLFEPGLQKELERVVRNEHDVDALLTAIVTQGWMPIDAMVVWKYPRDGAKYIVMEGNRRTVALRDLRNAVLPREIKKLESMKRRGATPKHELEAQENYVKTIRRVVADTDELTVVPLDAANTDELSKKLPRVLAVRHIQGARGWGNYAEDLWLLDRYTTLFKETHKGKELTWDKSLISRVAHEASLTDVKTKRQLQSAAAFSHFRSEYADRLPGEDDFAPTDYYLFENIVKRPWLREQFGLSQDAFHLDREAVLFAWVFAKPRGRNADENPNVFYRHENVLLWDQIHKYDTDNMTDFASRFDIEDPDGAPKMREVEAAYLTHKARSAPTEVLEQLLRQIGGLTQETLISQADFLQPKLESAIERCQQCVAMIDAGRSAARGSAPTPSVESASSTVSAKVRGMRG
jgi:hypothetical protein